MFRSRTLARVALALLLSALTATQATATVNACLNLSGRDYLAAGSVLVPTAREFTVSFRAFLRSNHGTYAEFIAQSGNFYVGVDPAYRIRIGNAWGVISTVVLPQNKWVMITITRSSAGLGTLYLDGQAAATKTGFTTAATDINTRIGAQFDPGASERLDGCLDDLTIWNRAWTAGEVAADFAATSAPSGADLLAYYDFSRLNPDGAVPPAGGSAASALVSEANVMLIGSDHPELVPVFKSSGALTYRADVESWYLSAYTPQPENEAMERNYGSGVSWYSTVWPLFTAPVGAAQAGLAATWVQPRSFLTNKADLFGSPQEKALYQSIEGSLGWWGDTAYRSPLPKYQPGATINSFRTGARDFWAGQPIPQGGGGWITLSNQILLPPEGMTFDPASSGGQLGQSWFALPWPKTGAALPFKAGPNAWTLFLNAANFKGPIAYIEPNFWAESVAAFPALAGLTFDNQFATSYLISGEFAAIPFYQITDQSGVVYAKIPPLQFPTDAGGRFVFARDYRTYNDNAVATVFASALRTHGALPSLLNKSGIQDRHLQASGLDVFQGGDAVPYLKSRLTLQAFDNGSAVGFELATPNANVVLPEYYVKEGLQRKPATAADAPSILQAVNFAPAKSVRTKVYQSLPWFTAGRAASDLIKTNLNDGSTVSYRWYKFIDQPMLARFNLTAEEKTALQALAEQIQREWANNPLQNPPSGGALVSFDRAVLVTPPPGLEIGYVPIVVRQEDTPPNLAGPSRLINLSILTAIDRGEVFSLGFVVGGAGTTGSKPLLLRAAGPSLTQFGVAGAHDDPKLEWFSGSDKMGENDNWGGAAATSDAIRQVAAFPFLAGTSKDAALFAPAVGQGNNSVRISGVADTSGTVIAELYETTPAAAMTAAAPRLINVSVLKQIGPGLTAGFVIAGTNNLKVLIRVVGPTLATFGVTNPVPDPRCQLFDAKGLVVASNNDWLPADSDTMKQVGAFPLPAGSRDAALVATLPPGNYTVQVGADGSPTGVALVEVYEVP